MTPLVSIIMATYNRSNLVGRAIKSVMEQSYDNWELIIINDASIDNTKSVLDEWQKKDSRIKIINNGKNFWQKEGVAGNLRKGMVLAKGKYIARIDDDDYWCDKSKLSNQVDFLEKNPEYVLCGTGVVVVDNDNKELFRYLKPEIDEQIRKKALFANPFAHASAVFLKEAAEKVGGYGNWKFTEDWDLWLKLGAIGKFYNLQEYSLCYLSDQNYSFLNLRAASLMTLDIIKAHRKSYPNFYKAYLLNYFQYLYTFLPDFIKKPLRLILSNIKHSISK